MGRPTRPRAWARVAALLAATALVLATLASGARADSLVYIRGGEVWISHADGTDARQLTAAPDNWSWPSEDDAGTIVVAGGAGGVGAEEEDTPGSEIYRLNQQGASLSAPQQTPGSASTPGCVTYPPEGLRVAPDGRHYAYDAFVCDHFYSLVGTVGGEGFSGSEYMSGFRFPYWVDDSDFVASRGGMPLLDSEGEWWVHHLGEAANYGYNWFGDPETYAEPGNPDGWATGFDGVAVSRDGSRVATLEEDASNWIDGAARRVAIRLWSADGAPTPTHTASPPAFRCELQLPPDPDTTAWFANAGPSFSPDGTRLAFAEPDGVHVADVSNLNDCASITAPLLIPGATQPFWSAAEEAADAGYAPPAGGGDGDAGSGSGTGAQPTPARDTKPPAIGALAMRPRRFAVAGAQQRPAAHGGAPLGSTVRYTLSEPAHVTFAVQLSRRGRRKGHRCVKGDAKRAHAPACDLSQTVGALAREGVRGANQLPFSGRLGHRPLAPGSYRLRVLATDAAGNRSAAAAVPFTIVRPARPGG